MKKILGFLKVLIVVALNKTTHSKTQRDLAIAKDVVDTLAKDTSTAAEKPTENA